MKYCGIDLHSNNSVVVVSDEEDRMVLQKRLPNDLSLIRSALEPHREELAGVVIESTYNWYWLVDGLGDAGYRVHLAHPSAIKKYEGLKHSGANQRRTNGFGIDLASHVAHPRQHLRITLARNNGPDDLQSGHSGDVADEVMQLQVHEGQRLLHMLEVGSGVVQMTLAQP